VAVVVGANGAAPGRRPLLYSHLDADRIAEVLRTVGGFRRENVQVLKDPTPAVLLTAVGEAVASVQGKPESLLYFYYSGHADESSLYPGGNALPLGKLRQAIDEAQVAVKVGVVDACRGGGWTRAKGLVPDEPFAVPWPTALGNEGSVLISSSSGLESAHESELLQGSFFTYHFAAGLRGAADRNGNREVTLTEAFDYAKERTIRDTLRLARQTQHPSYAVNLRGRRDLVLANVDASPTTLEVAQTEGPLQLIHVDSGLELLEIPAGKREIKLAVPPGRYVLRRTTATGNFIKELTVRQGGKNRIDEAELTLFGTQGLASKSASRGFMVEDLPPVARLDAAPPAPEKVSPEYKVAAWSAAGVAVVSLALGVKLFLDIQKINRDLDEYRRFGCNSSTTGFCDVYNRPANPLTPVQVLYVDAKKTDGDRLGSYQTVSFAIAGASAVASGWLFYRAYRAPTVQVVPVAAAGPGLTLAGRF
jgi:hypothetical protein